MAPRRGPLAAPRPAPSFASSGSADRAPLLEPGGWDRPDEGEYSTSDGANNGDEELDPLVPLLTSPLGEPTSGGCCCAPLASCWESCARFGNFCFFFTVCTASLIATAATASVCVADTGLIAGIYVWLAPEFRILKPQTGFAYHFNHTVNDMVWSSCARTLVAIVSHAFSTRQNLYRPYLWASIFTALGCGAHVAIKATTFDYHHWRRRPGAPGWVQDTWVAPLMFAVTLVACTAHVAVALSMRVHAAKINERQRKARLGLLGYLAERNGDAGTVGDASEPGSRCPRLHTPGAPSSTAARAGIAEVKIDSSSSASDSRGSFEGEVPAEALADPDSRFVDLGGVRHHYKDAGGDSDAPSSAAVVFVHGFGAGVFAWRRVAPALAAATGLRAVAMDRCGFGLSGRPARGEFPEDRSPYAITAQAEAVEELCVAVGVERAVFVGHADGCLVAMRAAANGLVPGRRVVTAGLVLLSADARLDAAVPEPVRLLLNTKLGMSMLRPLLRSEIGEVANRRAWRDVSKLTRGVLALYKRPLCVEGWDRSLMEAARTRQGMTQRDVAEWLRALEDVPTLMVTGADDVVAPPRRAVAAAAELRRCHLKILPRCGHLPHEEAPKELLEALAPFVRERLARSREGEGEGGGDERQRAT